MSVPGPGPRTIHVESTIEVENRLRGILPYINLSDLVQLRQLIPEYLQMTHVSRITTWPEVQFDFSSNVISTTSNRPLENRVDTQRRLRSALEGVSHHELNIMRQLVPQYLPNPDLETPNDNTNQEADQPRRHPRPVPPPTRCHSRSRSPELVSRSFVARCGISCSFSGCSKPCGKPVFPLGSPNHVRHYCQEHRAL